MDLKSFPKIEPMLELDSPPIKSPNHLLCIGGGCEFLGGLSHHLVEEKTNTKKGKKKNVKLQCRLG
jgi:hypothetical protein